MRIALLVTAVAVCGYASAKLPPPTEAAKSQAAEAAAKTAWSDKVAQYQLCLAMDRTAEAYRNGLKEAGKPIPSPSPIATPACVDPGPFVPPIAEGKKPLEAAGAHSPPETAVSPPSTKATAAEIAGSK